MVKIANLFPRKFRMRRFIKAKGMHGKLGFLIRYVWISTLVKAIGKNVAIFPDVYFEHLEKLELGENVSIHQMCYVDAGGGISIGNDVSIAHRVSILSSNHSFDDGNIAIKYQDLSYKLTTIGDNVWVGCGCVLLAGVYIGSGSVIGANSTVTKSIKQNSVAVGSPARIIKNR